MFRQQNSMPFLFHLVEREIENAMMRTSCDAKKRVKKKENLMKFWDALIFETTCGVEEQEDLMKYWDDLFLEATRGVEEQEDLMKLWDDLFLETTPGVEEQYEL